LLAAGRIEDGGVFAALSLLSFPPMPRPFLTVRHGASRTVLLVGSLAVKLPRLGNGWRPFLWGLLSNIAEREAGRDAHPWLCPVLWSIPGGWCVVMPRCAPLTAEEWESLAETPGPHHEAAGFDFKRSSFGRLGGRLVVFDYHGSI
jgi:hypothetical protein